MEIRFRLNSKNDKDKRIINFLSAEYSPTDTIKSLLYKLAVRNVTLEMLTIESANSQLMDVNNLAITPQIDDEEEEVVGKDNKTEFDEFF